MKDFLAAVSLLALTGCPTVQQFTAGDASNAGVIATAIGPPSAPCARLQSRQLHADVGDAQAVEPWSLTSLREKLIKIGTKVVSRGRYVTFQLAEVAVS